MTLILYTWNFENITSMIFMFLLLLGGVGATWVVPATTQDGGFDEPSTKLKAFQPFRWIRRSKQKRAVFTTWDLKTFTDAPR